MPLPEAERDPSDSSRWRVSAYREGRVADAPALAAAPTTVLSSTLLAELRRVDRGVDGQDILEVVAACLRHKESVLMHLDDGGYVLAITLFPQQRLFHTPLRAEQWSSLHWARLKLIDVLPAQLRPPGDVYAERVAASQRYGSLTILLWLLALHGPRRRLLPALDMRAAYRLTSAPDLQALPLAGALAPAVQRLRREAVTLRDLARMPGMDTERASRLLNALYLQSALMVLRSPDAGAPGPAPDSWWGRLRSRWGGL